MNFAREAAKYDAKEHCRLVVVRMRYVDPSVPAVQRRKLTVTHVKAANRRRLCNTHDGVKGSYASSNPFNPVFVFRQISTS